MDPILIVLLGIGLVLFCIIALRLNAVVALLLAAVVTGLMTAKEHIYNFAINKGLSPEKAEALASQALGERLADAFGSTSGKISILIALGSIIGVALMRSGGAERIIRSMLNVVGKKNTSLAFLSGSFTLAIPVFFDTVFYLMIPLVKSMSIRNPRKYSLYLMVVIAGGVMAHSLVPPTPGPLFVAKEMGIDLGLMMVVGIIFGVITSFAGYLYALWANRHWDLPMRDTPDISIEELKDIADTKQEDLPSLWLSLLPIVLPIVLITGSSFLDMFLGENREGLSAFQLQMIQLLTFLGNSNIALFVATLIAMYLLWSKLKNVELFNQQIQESLMSAGMIILITCSGGAFGQMLQQTNIGMRLTDFTGNAQSAILPLAFFLTAVIRTAQGSATVAMVTTIGIVNGMGGENAYPFHPVYLAIVIGCGSKIFPWMNDSGFWIISKMSGMTNKESIQHFSYLLTVMGFAGLISVMILSRLFPMV